MLLTSCLPMLVYAQKTLVAKHAEISFFSNAPLEDIQAISKTAASALNISTGDIVFKVRNTSFEFDKKLMQEHFNENYMESDKYPLSEFKGKIEEPQKLNKNGTYIVDVSGTLLIHGVTKLYQTKAKIIVKDNILSATCRFNVKLADHKIKIPSIVGRNIAEVVNIDISARYKPQ